MDAYPFDSPALHALIQHCRQPQDPSQQRRGQRQHLILCKCSTNLGSHNNMHRLSCWQRTTKQAGTTFLRLRWTTTRRRHWRRHAYQTPQNTRSQIPAFTQATAVTAPDASPCFFDAGGIGVSLAPSAPDAAGQRAKHAPAASPLDTAAGTSSAVLGSPSRLRFFVSSAPG